MNASINVAVVGYGLAGATFHTPLIKCTEGLKLRFIVTRSVEKQTQACKDHPDVEILPDFSSLMDRSAEIGLIVIATPNSEHSPQCRQALAAGIPVVVDKPVALSSAECSELIEIAQSKSLPFSVFQNRRWDNDFLTIKKLIDSGRLGTVLRFESRFERYRPSPKANAWREKLPAEEGGGILFDLGSHLIDQATQLFDRPERIYAEMNIRRAGIASDDDSFVALGFPSGVRAHLWMSAMSASQGYRFRVLGTEGAFEKYGMDPQEDALRAGMTPAGSGWGIETESAGGILTHYRDGEKIEEKIRSQGGCYQKFYEQMRDAVLGKCPVPVNPHDTLQTMRIIESARESAKCATALSL